MEVRITKLRVAIAALFVLAGVGLASLLSPLVGTALATVGQVVNISDHSASAYFAKVDSSGASKTARAGERRERSRVAGCAGVSMESKYGHPDSGTFIAGPSASPINVTSLSISTDAATGSGARASLCSATTCRQRDHLHRRDLRPSLWQIATWRRRDAGSFTFPTPLQWKAPANTKACLFATAVTSAESRS